VTASETEFETPPFETMLVDLLGRGIAVRFAASGDSMHPSIRNGEHVHVSPLASRPLRAGDVVLAQAARGITAHRIVRIARGAVITRGDNSRHRDAPVPHQSILGRITHVERDGATVAVPTVRHVRRALHSLSQLIRSLL
jgi:signal peptidase I